MTGTAGDTVQLSGRLTLEQSVALFNKGLPWPDGEAAVRIDFAQVEEVDSTAVSLMLSWLRAAQQKNVALAFVNVPENLLSLTKLYGVDSTLPLQAA